MPYVPKNPVTSIAQMETLVGTVSPIQAAKIIDHIDPLCAAWIARSTFLAMATTTADGVPEVSPKGDPAGFVHVLDRQTLAIPDRPGNHRFDSLRNILDTGQAGLMFLVPHRNEVLRVTGTAQIATDADLCAQLAINGRPATCVIVMQVKRAYFHCGKAIIRSALWSPERYDQPQDLPTYAEALTAHANVPSDAVPALEARLANNDANRLYDE